MDTPATPAPTQYPGVLSPTQVRAQHELKVLQRVSAEDPEPSQRYEPDEHFAWAFRETQRQNARHKWEALLP